MAADDDTTRTAVVTTDAVQTPPDEPTAPSQPTDGMAQTDDDPSNHRTTPAQAAELMGLVERGASVREAALQIPMPLRTAYRILQRSEDQLETMRGVVRKLMVAQTFQRIDDWVTASQVGARKRGNHSPARDWLLHAGVIDPLAQDADVSVRVAICIGTPDAPMPVTSPQVIDAERLTE